MKKFITILNIINAVYFFALANFFFWGSLLGLLFGVVVDPGLVNNPWAFITNIIFAPLLIYGAILFFRKPESKYTYGLVLLFLIWVENQIYRFFFVTEKTLEMSDLKNLLFFGIPFLVIWLTKYLHTKQIPQH